MKQTIDPVPCSRMVGNHKCGRLPSIINPEPGLFYAICCCPGHMALDGKYQFLGKDRDSAIKAWNDFHFLGVDKTEETIERIAQLLDWPKYLKEKALGAIHERKGRRYCIKNKRIDSECEGTDCERDNF